VWQPVSEHVLSGRFGVRGRFAAALGAIVGSESATGKGHRGETGSVLPSLPGEGGEAAQ
jgi:hypothetical protein